MLIYNIVFVFLLVLALLDISVRQKSFILFLIPLIALIILTGFRGNGGDDFIVYEKYFESVPVELYNYGYGYFNLNVAVKYFGEYKFFIFISALVCLCLQAVFIYRETNAPCLALFLFYSTSFLWLDFVLIRQSISTGFFLISILTFYRKRYVLSFIYFVLGFVFHETLLFAAIIFLIFYKLPNKTWIWLFLILILVTPFLSDILIVINDLTIKNKNISNYVSERTLPSLANAFEVLVGLGTLLLSKNKMKIYDKRWFMIYKSVVLCSFFILFVSYSVPPIARFLEYFRFFYFVLLANILMHTNLKNRYIIFFIISVYCLTRLNSFIYQFDSGFDYVFVLGG